MLNSRGKKVASRRPCEGHERVFGGTEQLHTRRVCGNVSVPAEAERVGGHDVLRKTS